MAKLYAVVCYLLFGVAQIWLVAFLTNAPGIRGIDGGVVRPWALAALADLALIALFGAQHSIMARRGFKRWWAGIVPAAVERSTYMLMTVLVLGVIFWLWQPIPAVIWAAHGALADVIWGLFWAGWALAVLSTFLIDHFQLFGLRPLVIPGGRAPGFRTPLVYRVVRHPLYLGMLLAFWAAPVMSAGHLLFAAGMTGYVLIGIVFEERDLLAAFGADYSRYRAEVSMLLPWRRGG